MLELKEIANILSGISVREIQNGSARFVRLSDLSNIKQGRPTALASGTVPAVARALAIEEGDLIVGARGTTIGVCIANQDVAGAFVSADLYLIRPDAALVNSQYLAAFLELPATQARFATSKQGSALARLPKDALEGTHVPVPPLQSQRLIAGLALSVGEEAKLLRKLTDLKESLGREAVASAIRSASAHDSSPRSPG